MEKEEYEEEEVEKEEYEEEEFKVLTTRIGSSRPHIGK